MKLICGVAVVDYSCISAEDKRLRGVWNGMIRRCYSDNGLLTKYHGDKGCFVCSRWLYLSNYIADVKAMRNYDKYKLADGKWHLDKDFGSNELGCLCYSPYTCNIIPSKCNNNLTILNRQYEHTHYRDRKGKYHY